MQLLQEAELLRIFVGENDKVHGRPVYEVITETARQHGMAGATVLAATLGYGAHSEIHSAKVLRISEDLPMIVEIVDTPERIAAFLPELDKIMDAGLVTLEKIRVIRFRQRGSA